MTEPYVPQYGPPCTGCGHAAVRHPYSCADCFCPHYQAPKAQQTARDVERKLDAYDRYREELTKALGLTARDPSDAHLLRTTLDRLERISREESADGPDPSDVTYQAYEVASGTVSISSESLRALMKARQVVTEIALRLGLPADTNPSDVLAEVGVLADSDSGADMQ